MNDCIYNQPFPLYHTFVYFCNNPVEQVVMLHTHTHIAMAIIAGPVLHIEHMFFPTYNTAKGPQPYTSHQHTVQEGHLQKY